MAAVCWVSVIALACAAYSPASPALLDDSKPTAKTPGFPDTVAGKLGAAFIEAFNSGDVEVMRAFEAEKRAKSALKRRSIEDRLKQYQDLYADWGRLEIVDVLTSGERDLTVIAVATRIGANLEMEFELESESPYGLVAIRIASHSGPTGRAGPVGPVDAKTVAETVEAIAAELDESYVFPEIGHKMAERIRERLAEGAYADTAHAAVPAARFTSDLQAICHDRHLRVRVSNPDEDRHSPDTSTDWPARDQWSNYGFETVQRLPGNLGYLKFNQFHPGPEAEGTAAAAMRFLADCDALIFDLRNNGGGSPRMIAFLTGYLFDESVHLNTFYERPTDSTSETWSRDDVPGERFGEDVPVFVLTSSYTFSGAEEFTYNLKHLGRATIIGENTGGGAHPVFMRKLNDTFSMSVPFARAINPITKTNWEGVGIPPHIEVPAAQALLRAQKEALERLIGSKGERPEHEVEALRRALGTVERALADSDKGVAVRE